MAVLVLTPCQPTTPLIVGRQLYGWTKIAHLKNVWIKIEQKNIEGSKLPPKPHNKGIKSAIKSIVKHSSIILIANALIEIV